MFLNKNVTQFGKTHHNAKMSSFGTKMKAMPASVLKIQPSEVLGSETSKQ